MTEHPFSIRAQTMIFCSFLLARKVVQFREYKGLSVEVDQRLVVSLAASLWTDFLLSIATLPSEDLPRQIQQCRLQESHTKSWIPLLESQINVLTFTTLIQNTPSKSCLKGCIKRSFPPAPVEPGRGQE